MGDSDVYPHPDTTQLPRAPGLRARGFPVISVPYPSVGRAGYGQTGKKTPNWQRALPTLADPALPLGRRSLKTVAPDPDAGRRPGFNAHR